MDLTDNTHFGDFLPPPPVVHLIQHQIGAIIMAMPLIDISAQHTHSLMLYIHSLQPDSAECFE